MSIEQLKFRGQVKTNLLKISKGTFVIAPDDITFECFFRGIDVGYIDPATVGQWTGNEIGWWQDDIVANSSGDKYVICWHFNRWGLRQYRPGQKLGRFEEIDKTSIQGGFFKVVGNIHEEARNKLDDIGVNLERSGDLNE